ncbi:hypothetical protein, partial [Pseudoclavibacter sp. RFBG4]|uniref:hypothetical protein n=1 Tax=Pseudoclavibacter sp. RFBG4 TaxID=2080575 RepID=UPI001CA489EA
TLWESRSPPDFFISRGWLLSEQRCSSMTNPGFFSFATNRDNTTQRRSTPMAAQGTSLSFGVL